MLKVNSGNSAFF